MNNKIIFLSIILIFVLSVQGIAQESVNQKIEGKIMKAQASFKILGWDEDPFSEVEESGKLTRVSVSKSYSGDIQGEGKLEYLMRYHENGSADFYGLERVTGEIDGRSGSFILEHTGTFKDGKMNQKSIVLNDSGTGDLVGLQGEIKLIAGHQQEYPFTFKYQIE